MTTEKWLVLILATALKLGLASITALVAFRMKITPPERQTRQALIAVGAFTLLMLLVALTRT